ncbi:hypothetical protein A3D00_04695 [Candidatus Woesebacteria bacterium RIFCSPHIGHO2_02_FULL_38_9]|uniref:Large ribosomal subunit protein bL25 n=1 Tax=Candidatus Woesebacteria bacterium RIFCSPHIGHO2_01_FULL_39_28 TaxID=1802496 RepID=A0A1F7YL56_9BACT|nr:MAG: hypothetical protein A2627_00525 [Candidatus Woesebacteria bacterium RIFCSPHIGHO2_01_FULL_39_28]OGM31924.1 MAG: hypothetical protein A3D00_04695 [Candidatus Woesebacteria bacterium RIFCSPHIGHO2_02_FULL_38_9]OGM56704.1 MAG: hypothetical protein A3A50_05095 [Candidatus Woesebacteria bacterium RIFCSPLOWO2_01_FULL_38_20]
MEKIVLKAKKREIFGRKVKTLRKKGLLPANLYGRNVKSLGLEVGLEEFSNVYKKAGKTGLLEITLDKSKKPVLVHNVQTDPVTDEFIHVDFLQVDLKQKVSAAVPVELVGESPAEKSGVGTVVLQLDQIEVEALPSDLPEKFSVDISSLIEVDQSVLVKDLKYDRKKVEVKTDPNQIVIKVEPPQKEEQVTTPAAETQEVVSEKPLEASAEADKEAPEQEKKE